MIFVCESRETIRKLKLKQTWTVSLKHMKQLEISKLKQTWKMSTPVTDKNKHTSDKMLSNVAIHSQSIFTKIR